MIAFRPRAALGAFDIPAIDCRSETRVAPLVLVWQLQLRLAARQT